MNLDLPWNPAVLEQRIGRAHRLGQHRPVQVYNFVAEASIEHNLMGLLDFKQALADGVLDGGAKEIHLGGSRLTRFMENVERVTARAVQESWQLPSSGTAVSNLESQSSAAAGRTAAESPVRGAVQRDRDPWRSLLEFGEALLADIADGQTSDQEKRTGSLVRRDSATGASYLHLPLPDPDTISRLGELLRDLLTRR
jgi:hypothetical protein